MDSRDLTNHVERTVKDLDRSDSPTTRALAAIAAGLAAIAIEYREGNKRGRTKIGG